MREGLDEEDYVCVRARGRVRECEQVHDIQRVANWRVQCRLRRNEEGRGAITFLPRYLEGTDQAKKLQKLYGTHLDGSYTVSLNHYLPT